MSRSKPYIACIHCSEWSDRAEELEAEVERLRGEKLDWDEDDANCVMIRYPDGTAQVHESCTADGFRAIARYMEEKEAENE